MEKTEIEAKQHLHKNLGFPKFIHLSLYEVVIILFRYIQCYLEMHLLEDNFNQEMSISIIVQFNV